MTSGTCDVVVVGARCAGAALATYLARAGVSVVVLEAGRLGTDQVVSTHTVHPAGMDVLDELGVGAAVRRYAPPARRIRLQFDDARLDVEPPAGRDECCPRRQRLDGLLQEAAAAAGARMCERTRVTALVRARDRVVGVIAEQGGRSVELRAALVVGADGRHSTVAKLCGAEEYLGYDWPRGAYWAYWDPPDIWRSRRYPYDALLRYVGRARRFVFTTDHGRLLVGTMPSVAETRRWRSDGHTAAYLADLRSDDVIAPLVATATRASRVSGTVGERCFFRRAAGPGWVLVGDAGHHKDPLIGWGISEALVQAQQVALAIVAGGDATLERWWRQRDVDVLPRFRLGEDRGALRPMSRVAALVLERAGGVPGLAEHLFRETEYAVNPYALVPARHAVLWVLRATLGGRVALLADLARMGARGRDVGREVRARRALLESIGPQGNDRIPWRRPADVQGPAVRSS